MTNYNERLDEVIKEVDTPAWLQQVHKTTNVPAYQLHVHEAKQAITSLIKELVAEAKPKTMPSNLSPENYEKCERVVNQYHQNLLKALEEVK